MFKGPVFLLIHFVVFAIGVWLNVAYLFPFTTFSKAHIAGDESKSLKTGKSKNAYLKAQQENHRPVVKISAPTSNSSFKWNATVPYTITVSDPEDGESEYQEITPNEVFLEVKFVADAAKAASMIKQPVKSAPAGFNVIKGSNCFNCHTMHTKLIGPSFYDISKRYPNTKPNMELLMKRIREGSTGVWGTVSMPTHPELTPQQTQNIVQWIFKNGAQPGLDYYRGMEGSFRLKPPTATTAKGVFILTATYTDHGTKDAPAQTLTGQDVTLIRCEK